MKLVKYQGRSPDCIEGFPEDCSRNEKSAAVKSALHLRPGQVMELTDDEYAFIKAQRPDLSKNLVLLRDEKDQPKAQSKEEVKAEDKMDAKADMESEAKSDSKGSAKAGKQK